MKNDHQSHEFLGELLGESSAKGPSMDTVLTLVRAERRRRRQRQGALATATLAVLGAMLVLWSRMDRPPQVAAIESNSITTTPAVAQAAAPFAIKRVNDEELLDLLAGQAVALVKLPDGERQLLMVIHEAGSGQ